MLLRSTNNREKYTPAAPRDRLSCLSFAKQNLAGAAVSRVRFCAQKRTRLVNA